MVAARRYPLRMFGSVEAACARVHPAIHTGGVAVSTVKKLWPAETVVGFALCGASSRRERLEKRGDLRAAKFHARPRAGLAVVDALAAGLELAHDLLSFAENVCGCELLCADV